MISNFITPPDLVDSVLIINATKDQIQETANVCQNLDKCFNVYVYENGMDKGWITKIFYRANIVLINKEVELDVNFVPKYAYEFNIMYFGPLEKLKNPVEYFTVNI